MSRCASVKLLADNITTQPITAIRFGKGKNLSLDLIFSRNSVPTGIWCWVTDGDVARTDNVMLIHSYYVTIFITLFYIWYLDSQEHLIVTWLNCWIKILVFSWQNWRWPFQASHSGELSGRSMSHYLDSDRRDYLDFFNLSSHALTDNDLLSQHCQKVTHCPTFSYGYRPLLLALVMVELQNTCKKKV